MHKLKRTLSALIFLICTLTCCIIDTALCSCSPVDSSPVIKVGISEYPNYAQTDPEGRPYGPAVEYICKLATYADMNVQVTVIGPAEDFFNALDSGKVDMLVDVIRTDDRLQKYLFSDYDTGSYPTTIYTKNDNPCSYGDIKKLSGMTFGVEKGSYVLYRLLEFGSLNDFEPKYHQYTDISAINAAIDTGEIDAGVYSSSSIEGYRTVMQFSPESSYIAFRKNESGLKTAIDSAMSQLIIREPLYREKLQDSYSVSVSPEMEAYTAEEDAYIKEHPYVTVAVLNDDEPFFDLTRNQKYKGILPDYYSQLSELTGLKFRYRVYSSQAEAMQAIQNGEADIIGMYSGGTVSAYDNGLRLTAVYGTSVAVFVTKAGQRSNSIDKIACKERSLSAIRSGLDSDISDKLVTYETASKCFDALRSGRADAMIAGLPSATWLVNQTNSTSYSISAIPTIEISMSGALDYDNTVLWSIMNKAIRISNYNFNSLISQDTLAENNWHTYISRIPQSLLIMYMFILFIFTVVLIFALVSLLRRQKEKTQMAKALADNERKQLQLEALEKNAEERNQFFSGISHDMRTPLNAILGFSALASQKSTSPEVNDYLSKITTSGTLLLDLINDTLTISKINSGKLHLNYAPVYTDIIIDEITVPIESAARDKDITFTVQNNVQGRMIMTDKLSLQKILLNLLSNAVKYTPSGGTVDLIINEIPEEDNTPGTEFIIKDTGIGISPDYLPHIYEPFSQESRSGTGNSGTGLGLSIVSKLVNLMNGSIDVISEVDKGTTFTVHLHFTEESAGHINSDSVKPVTVSDITGKSILIFEDNDLNREITCALLASLGLKADTAVNGKAGIDIFSASCYGQYSAILMDIRMPVMDGYEAARRIRLLDRPDAVRIPIIATTADAFSDDIKKCLDAGMNDHVAKPINMESLSSALHKWIH